jgi:hypothetical protein
MLPPPNPETEAYVKFLRPLIVVTQKKVIGSSYKRALLPILLGV